MNVKNYRARTAEECIRKLKSDMGRDAVILQSRTLRRPVFGVLGPVMHEITAISDGNTLLDTLGRRAAERQAEIAPPTLAPVPRLSMTGGPSAMRSPLRTGGRLTLAEAASLAESGAEGREAALALIAEAAGLRDDDDRAVRFEKQVAALSEAFAPASRPAPAPPAAVAAPASSAQRTPPAQPGGLLRYRTPAAESPIEAFEPDNVDLVECDPYQPLFDQVRRARVAEALVRRLRGEMPEGLAPDASYNKLHELLVGRIHVSGAIAPSVGRLTVAALVGPTGVGKTTTVAKLAASLSLSKGVSVGMISLDTQRVAGTAQLTTYGEILGIPVRVAYDKAEMEKALVEMATRRVEVVLIDTPGCGASEALSIAGMSASLRSVVNLSSYLVLPATLSASNFEHTLVRFAKVASPKAMIVSKLDETADNHCLGFLINAQAKHHIPLAYVTTGARVPDDLMLADAHALIAKMLTPSLA